MERCAWLSNIIDKGYIMVDEFQDSSAVEMRLVDILLGVYENLMIVGAPEGICEMCGYQII